MAVETERTVAVTRELAMRVRRPDEIDVSSDGTRIAFTVVSQFAAKGGAQETSLWLIDGAGEPTQATSGHVDSVPRLSPDGTFLAFASDRVEEGRMALHVLDDSRAEPRPLGEISGSVEAIRFSPDGSELLVLAADLGADRAGVQTATRIETQGAEADDPRIVRPARHWRRLYRVQVESGETREVGPEGVNVWEFDWPGEARAVALCSDEPSESAWYDAYVALLDLEARTARRLYQPEWQVQAVRLSPDGARAAFVEGLASDREVVSGTVRVLELDGGEARELAPAEASWLEWRDDESLWFCGWKGMAQRCGTIALDGAINDLYGGDVLLGARFQPRAAVGGGRVLAVREAPGEPAELVELAEREARPLTALNEELAPPLRSIEHERFTWTSFDGLEIEGHLLRPRARSGEALPLVVIVHGGPTGASGFEAFPLRGEPVSLASAGYAVLLPNPRGSVGRGHDFAQANLGDMGGGDLKDVLAGVDALVDAGIADTERVGVMGGSYGGFMAAWAVTQTDRFAASVAVSCVSHWLSFHLTTNIGQFDVLFLAADPYDPDGEYAARSPVLHASRCRTPTLIVHGEKDLCTPLGQAQELYQALVEAGCETELVIYAREGHGTLEWDHQIDLDGRIRGWFDRHLKPA
jgi:dipeptidyl aminopeptidase/acylaminoacyl peptidase